MQGDLDLIGKSCMRERADTGANFSCLLVQLVRHPYSTLKSERHSARLPQARGVKNPTIIAPGGSAAWMETRAQNMTGFCEPILKDLKYAMQLKRRKARLLRKGQIEQANAIPDVLILKYDDLLRRPLEVVREAHDLLQAYTSQPKLQAFVKAHLDPNYTINTGAVTAAPVVSMANVTGGKAVVHKLRKRLKTEFGTVRPPRSCDKMQPMDEWPVCAELLKLLHPVYLC